MTCTCEVVDAYLYDIYRRIHTLIDSGEIQASDEFVRESSLVVSNNVRIPRCSLNTPVFSISFLTVFCIVLFPWSLITILFHTPSEAITRVKRLNSDY